MGTTTGVGFVPTPTQVEEYTHRLTGNKTGTVYTHTVGQGNFKLI